MNEYLYILEFKSISSLEFNEGRLKIKSSEDGQLYFKAKKEVNLSRFVGQVKDVVRVNVYEEKFEFNNKPEINIYYDILKQGDHEFDLTLKKSNKIESVINLFNSISLKPNLTFHLSLKDNELEFFYRGGSFYLGSIVLKKLGESDKKQERKDKLEKKLREKAINRLKFNHQTDDVDIFIEDFSRAFEHYDEEAAKIYLKKFYLKEDEDHFEQFETLEQKLLEFRVKYDGEAQKRELENLKSTGLEKGIEHCLRNRFKYYEVKWKGMPVKFKLEQMRNDLPAKWAVKWENYYSPRI